MRRLVVNKVFAVPRGEDIGAIVRRSTERHGGVSVRREFFWGMISASVTLLLLASSWRKTFLKMRGLHPAQIFVF